MENVYEWCVYNSTKANSDRFQFIILGNTGSYTLQIGDITIKSAASVTLLDIRIDSKLNFKEHKNNIVKKAYVCPQKTTKVYNIRKSQNLSMFNDRKSICLFVWMICGKHKEKNIYSLRRGISHLIPNTRTEIYE